MKKSEQKSAEPGKGNKTEGLVQQKSSQKGKTPKQIMSRHMQDKNDVITEEDFNNLNINTAITNDTSHEPLTISNDPERPKDEDKDPVVTTPWDIIS